MAEPQTSVRADPAGAAASDGPASAEASIDAPPRAAARFGSRVAALVAPAAALAAYLVLAFGVFANAWHDPFRYGIGVRGDPSQFMWFLSWFPFAAAHGLNPFFSDFVVYPTGTNLLWNTSVPLVAYVLSPVTALSPLLSYDLMETLALALSAWTGFLLLRRYVTRPLAAAVGSLLYGFSPYMFAQSLGHPHVTLVFLPPIILLLLDEIVRVQRRPPTLLGAALGAACVAQFFISEEVLVVTGLTAFVLLVIAAALWPRQSLTRARGAAGALLLAGGLFAAAAAWPVYFQLRGPQDITGATHPQNVFVNDLLGFWVPSQMQWFAPSRALRISASFSGNYSEWNSYLGVPLSLLLAYIAVRWWRNGWVRLAALSGAVVAILSLGVTVHLDGSDQTWLPVFAVGLLFLLLPPRAAPVRVLVLVTFVGWLALWRLPLLDSVVSDRLVLLVYLLAGLLLAVFVDELADLGSNRLAAGAVALVVALAPLVPRLPYLTTEFQVPAFFSAGGEVWRVPEGSVALVAPVAIAADVDPMLWQAQAGVRYRMPEGYVFVPAPPPAGSQLNAPPSTTTNALIDIQYGRPSPIGDESVRTSIRAELAAWHVRTVIVGPMANRDAAVALMAWVLATQPDETGGVAVWWNVDTSD